MNLAILILGLVEHLLTAADKMRQNNQQSHEMTPEEEAEFDKRRAALRVAPHADPAQNE